MSARPTLADQVRADQERAKRDACRRAGAIFAAACRAQDARTVEEAARLAWYPEHPLTLPQLEDKIRTGRERRAEAARVARSAS